MLNYYEFSQNNSGGSFDGPAHLVLVEAETPEQANLAGALVGLYFDGVGDCECCGQRWYGAYGSPDTAETFEELLGEIERRLADLYRKQDALILLSNGFAMYVVKTDSGIQRHRVNVQGFKNVPDMLGDSDVVVSTKSRQLSSRGF